MRWRVFVATLIVVNLALLTYLLRGLVPSRAMQGEKVTATAVRAQAVELVDSRGDVRAQLYLGADGGGNLRLRAANGEVRVKIGATEEGGGLMFADGRTEPAVQLGANGPSDPHLTLTAAENRRTVLSPSHSAAASPPTLLGKVRREPEKRRRGPATGPVSRAIFRRSSADVSS